MTRAKGMKKLLLVFLVLFQALPISAAITGKVAGRVVDEANGQALVGANIIIEGTALGAFTDNDGYYSILNIPPGTYNVIATMMGYAKMTLQDAQVKMDLTTTLDFSLKTAAFEMDAVVAEAKRPVVQLDMSSSQMNISSEEIDALPVTSVTEVIGLQAGAEGLTIRGSSSTELLYNIDGLALNDERSNVPYTSLPLSSVDQVKVQTGGFAAEYDNARSGVVQITTKEGSKTKYEGSFTMNYDPPQPKHFGNSIYDPMGFHLRPYNDPDVMWTGTQNWPDDMQKSYPGFMGFNALSQQLIMDKNPNNDLSPAALRELFLYQYRQQQVENMPDYVADLGFGGPVPVIGKYLGDLRFFASYRDEQSVYVIPLSRDTYRDNNLNVKLTADLSQKTKLNIILMRGVRNAVTTTNWSTPSTGSYFASTSSVANLASDPATAFIPSTYNPQTITRMNLGFTIKHQFNSNSFAELYFNSLSNKYHAFRDTPRDTTTFDLFPQYSDFSYYVNEFPFGYYADGPNTVTGMRTDWMGFAMDESKVTTNTLKFDYTNQINRFHLLKTGLALVQTDNMVDSWLENAKSTWRFYNNWHQKPIRFGTYIQDKMEYEELVVNAGIRFDMYNAMADWYDLDTYDALLNANNGFNLETKAPTKKTKSVYSVNPRLGIAHPISAQSKIYFNYGHFSMVPQSQYLFLVDRLGVGSVRSLGNPELEFTKTIQYEIGYEHSLFQKYLLKIAGYYKDVKNQPNWTLYTNYDETVSYYTGTSNAFVDIRGLELTAEKKYGDFVRGFINYTYSIQSSGIFGIARYFENPQEQANYIRRNPVISKPVPRPFINASLSLMTPHNFRALGLPKMLTQDWRLNFLYYWKKGSKFTNTDYSNIINAFEWVDYYNVDMKVSKTLNMGSRHLRLFLNVSNLLDLKWLSTTGFAGTNDSRYYYGSLKMWFEEGSEHGNDLVGTTDKDKSYINMPNMTSLTYLNPRRVTFGITVNF